ncbi:MAG: protein phosphatase 2C domain-containing protein [Hyphomicrobiaceae bacterium]
MSINTAWQSPWLLAAVAEHGEHHYDEGAPVQDAHRLSLVGRHTILALADGVSTQPRSAVGARLAVATAEAYLASVLTDEVPDSSTLHAAMAAAHRAISELAERESLPTRAFASTLAVAVLTGNHVAAAGVGDSSILAYTEKGAAHRRRIAPFLCIPQGPGRGVYSISEPSWLDRVTTRAETLPDLKGLLLTSDGANNLFTVENGGAGVAGFDCEQLDSIDEVLAEYGPRRFAFFWAGYLAGTPANDLDDRTILMAYRPANPPTFKGV